MGGLEATGAGDARLAGRRGGLTVLSAATGTLGRTRRLLCLGAHSDDLEIGCGGTVLKLLTMNPGMRVDWVVLSASGERAVEARESAALLLEGATESHVVVEGFRERYFPYDPGLKEFFDDLGRRLAPDLVLTPWKGDAHQDHRVVAELAANTFRDQLILQYEIPKYDGDVGRPNAYVHLDRDACQRKVDAIVGCFRSQKDRHWFSDETFWAMLRLRGIECAAPSGYAEAFHAHKIVLG